MAVTCPFCRSDLTQQHAEAVQCLACGKHWNQDGTYYETSTVEED